MTNIQEITQSKAVALELAVRAMERCGHRSPLRQLRSIWGGSIHHISPDILSNFEETRCLKPAITDFLREKGWLEALEGRRVDFIFTYPSGKIYVVVELVTPERRPEGWQPLWVAVEGEIVDVVEMPSSSR